MALLYKHLLDKQLVQNALFPELLQKVLHDILFKHKLKMLPLFMFPIFWSWICSLPSHQQRYPWRRLQSVNILGGGDGAKRIQFLTSHLRHPVHPFNHKWAPIHTSISLPPLPCCHLFFSATAAICCGGDGMALAMLFQELHITVSKGPRHVALWEVEGFFKTRFTVCEPLREKTSTSKNAMHLGS